MAKTASRSTLQRERQELKALQRLTRVLHATLDVREVLQRLLPEVASLLTARCAAVILHHDAAKEAELITTSGTEAQGAAVQHFRYPLPGSLTGWVAEHQCPLRVPRLTPEEWPAAWALTERVGLPAAPLAVLLVPLCAQGKVMGSLAVGWEPGHGITDHEEQLLAAIAAQAAIALTNATLYQEKAHAPLTLQETHGKVNAILDSITDGFIALDRHWRFTYLNHQAQGLLRRTQAELLGKNAWAEFPVLSTFTPVCDFYKGG